MKIIVSKRFSKDSDDLPIHICKQLDKFFDFCDTINNINELWYIFDIKKTKWTSDKYRIRLWDYRIGLFYEQESITLLRIMHRWEIYKYFP